MRALTSLLAAIMLVAMPAIANENQPSSTNSAIKQLAVGMQYYPLPAPPYSKEWLSGFCTAASAYAFYKSVLWTSTSKDLKTKIIFTGGKNGSVKIECDYRPPPQLPETKKGQPQ